ncbi:MAG: GtrA family protein [Chloroflexi bacterium]|nr:GtrA family protein [Chloroflexota bacterium]
MTLSKLIKFAAVGLSGVVVNSLALMVFYQAMQLPLIAASTMAVETAIVNNFLLNNRWTFDRVDVSLARFAKFNLVSLGGLAITVSCVFLLVSYASLNYLLANLFGIVLATTWNFGINVIWTWRWDG